MATIKSYTDLLQSKKLADAMYYAAQHLTTDASRLHKAMDEYHQFIINEYHKEEHVSEDLNTVAKEYANNITEKIGYRLQLRRAVCFGANWKKEQLMAKAIDGEVGYWNLRGLSINTDLPRSVSEGDKVKIIVIKED